MNIRLFPDQVERLKKSGNGAAVLRYAYDRYKRGDFGRIVVQKADKKAKAQTVPLASYPVRCRLPVKDAVLREILRRHWLTPDTVRNAQMAAEIATLDAEISELFRAYTGVDYIAEDQPE